MPSIAHKVLTVNQNYL